MAQPSTREEPWKPRFYYIMVNKTSGKKYIGQTIQNLDTYMGSGVYWKNHCKSHGGYSRDNILVIESHYFEIKSEASIFLEEFEKNNDFYWTEENKEWANLCKENTEDNPFYDREISVRNNSKRLENGTHNFLRDNQSDAMIYNKIGNEGFNKSIYEKYGVDNAMKHPEISRKSGIAGSNTKSSQVWKESVEPVRVEKYKKTMNLIESNGKTKKENRNVKVGEKNTIHHRNRVKNGTHQYQNGFYGVLEDGSVSWVSSAEYKERKDRGCNKYAHPTSFEAKKRRASVNGTTI